MRQLVDAFGGLRVVVIGDALVDCWLEGGDARMCREAPVPAVRVGNRVDRPGGGANAAANVAALGASVTLVAVTGTGDNDARLRAGLDRHGVDTAALVQDDAHTTPVVHRIVASDQLVFRFDDARDATLSEGTMATLDERIEELWRDADAVLVSDYGRGMMSNGRADVVARLQTDSPTLLAVDSRHPIGVGWLHPTIVKPNWQEVAELVTLRDAQGVRVDEASTRGDRILDVSGAQIAAVTLDVDGAVVFERGRAPHWTYPRAGRVRHTVGAGDTFLAAFTCAIAAGGSSADAAELASVAAGIAIEKAWTATCSAHELNAALSLGGKRLDTLADVAAQMTYHRAMGRQIAFTNGCFDILHGGHVAYLNRAKAFGDVLVVGVNDDASVARVKGPQRPVNPLDDRLAVLAALSCVDHVVPFSGETPEDLLRCMHPDVYVKGGDYSLDSLPEAALLRALGTRIEFMPYVEDRSTTALIERIRRGAKVPVA